MKIKWVHDLNPGAPHKFKEQMSYYLTQEATGWINKEKLVKSSSRCRFF